MATSDRSDQSYGPCRCCLARGYHRNVTKEYFFNGLCEVYSEIFNETFNLSLSTNIKLTSLICATCIHRLRDATSFRMMVVSTEKQLLDAISRGREVNLTGTDEESQEDVRPRVKHETRELKSEHEESHLADTWDSSTDNVTADSVPHNIQLVEGEAYLLARYKQVPALPTLDSLPDICPEYCRHLDLLRNITILPKSIENLVNTQEITDETRTARRQYISEKLAHITNASTILEFSNVTPFRSKNRLGFPCFYCRSIFENWSTLKEHTLTHKRKEMFRALKNFGAESIVVYVDITDLKCTICKLNIANLSDLKIHLINEHKKKMHLDFTDRVVPFKLTEYLPYVCQICWVNFETFGSIERHMNVHFRNYICKECGNGYVTRYRLKVHVKSMHAGGSFPCEVCGKMFGSTQKHKNHVNAVHKQIKRFKCQKCPERFGEYFSRQKHMVQVHGLAPLRYKCNVCDKIFDRRYTLSRHMKRDHLEERDYQCELCSYSCFTRNELRVHMVKHNGERTFECCVCKKAYARKKTLKEHMRIHNNDRRFACAVCGQTFVQKCSLKGHLKTHHIEFTLN